MIIIFERIRAIANRRFVLPYFYYKSSKSICKYSTLPKFLVAKSHTLVNNVQSFSRAEGTYRICHKADISLSQSENIAISPREIISRSQSEHIARRRFCKHIYLLFYSKRWNYEKFHLLSSFLLSLIYFFVRFAILPRSCYSVYVMPIESFRIGRLGLGIEVERGR